MFFFSCFCPAARGLVPFPFCYFLSSVCSVLLDVGTYGDLPLCLSFPSLLPLFCPLLLLNNKLLLPAINTHAVKDDANLDSRGWAIRGHIHPIVSIFDLSRMPLPINSLDDRGCCNFCLVAYIYDTDIVNVLSFSRRIISWDVSAGSTQQNKPLKHGRSQGRVYSLCAHGWVSYLGDRSVHELTSTA